MLLKSKNANLMAMRTALFLLALAAAGAQAQHQPYSGQQRDIKALAAEEVEQYLSGAPASARDSPNPPAE